MEKLKKFNLEDDYLEIKESLEYPCVSLTDDNGKLWVKEKPISHIIAKYYISEEDVNKNIYLFANYYYDFHYMVDYYVVDDGTTTYNTHISGQGIDEHHKFTTSGEHTIIFYIDINKMHEYDNDNMINLNYAFGGVKELISIDFSHFLESSHVNSMENMFSECRDLTSVTFGDNFDTSNVTTMDSMFSGCTSLTSLDLSSFNTSSLIEMSFMFSGCFNITSLDLSGWDISKVNDGWCAFGFSNKNAVIGVDPTLDVFNCMPI
jgi:surface protein